MSLDHNYRLASHLKNFPKGFPGGVWKLKSEKFTYYLEQFVPDVCALKPNRTRTSPARSYTPNEAKAKKCPEIKSQVARMPQKHGKMMP